MYKCGRWRHCKNAFGKVKEEQQDYGYQRANFDQECRVMSFFAGGTTNNPFRQLLARKNWRKKKRGKLT